MGKEYDIEDFQRDVIERSRTVPVVVDFWAEWCAPCRVLGPTLERLAGKAGGAWVLAKVDTEQFPQVATSYGIRSIPDVKLFVDGQAVNEFSGAVPEPMIITAAGSAHNAVCSSNIPARKMTRLAE